MQGQKLAWYIVWNCQVVHSRSKSLLRWSSQSIGLLQLAKLLARSSCRFMIMSVATCRNWALLVTNYKLKTAKNHFMHSICLLLLAWPQSGLTLPSKVFDLTIESGFAVYCSALHQPYAVYALDTQRHWRLSPFLANTRTQPQWMLCIDFQDCQA